MCKKTDYFLNWVLIFCFYKRSLYTLKISMKFSYLFDRKLLEKFLKSNRRSKFSQLDKKLKLGIKWVAIGDIEFIFHSHTNISNIMNLTRIRFFFLVFQLIWIYYPSQVTPFPFEQPHYEPINSISLNTYMCMTAPI